MQQSDTREVSLFMESKINGQIENNVPLNSNDFLRLKTKISNELPIEYDAFLSATNGGLWVSKKNIFDIPLPDGRKTHSDVYCFYQVSGDKEHKIIFWLELYGERLPEDFIPIANNSLGDQVLMNLSDGSIYFWDHELEDEHDVMYNCFYIADSFPEFINKLYKPSNGDEKKNAK